MKDLRAAYERMAALLREADEMWAFSTANLARGSYDCEWNAKRIKLLQELGEPTK